MSSTTGSQSPPNGLIPYGPDANCTLELCPIEWTVYRYRPSLAANGTFIALFALAIGVHVFLGIRWRSWGFMTFMILGCTEGIIGYVGRILMYHNPFSFAAFMMQIVCITSAPVFFTAAIYVTLSKIVMHFAPELCRFNPKLFYWVFIPADLVCLVLQAAGGAMSSSSSGSSQTGIDIAMAGLILQVIILFVFCVLLGDYLVRYFRQKSATALSGKMRIFFGFLSLSVLLILGRCLFRCYELSEGYQDSDLITDEPLFIGLEGVLVVLAVFSLCIGHPGLVFNSQSSTRAPMSSTDEEKPEPLLALPEGSANPKPTQTVRLDPEGDVTLVIEGNDDTQHRFLASSVVLRLASPVFAKMFGPNFKEGADIRSGQVPSISLGDDDPKAMDTILRIIHHQCSGIAFSLPPAVLASLAVHSDKYDCNRALKPWIAHWCNDFRDSSSVEDIGFTILAGYLFRSPTFPKIMANATKKLPGSFLTTWEDQEFLGLLPDSVSVELSERMSAVRAILHEDMQATEGRLREEKAGYLMETVFCIHCGRNHPGTAKKCHPCNNPDLYSRFCTSDLRVSEYFSILRRCELWPSMAPLRERSLSEIGFQFECATKDHKHKCGAREGCPLLYELEYLYVKVERALKNIQGLTLEEIKGK
ncbi:Efflux pump himE [Paramyrothecium foliicola]|nr:Efflux pump himE [Paramyrothecium foliicola]